MLWFMEDYILISQLNDFIFCPYSIYLHNVYTDASEDVYHATPQTQGRIAHETVDKKTESRDKNTLLALPVYSEHYGLLGKKLRTRFSKMLTRYGAIRLQFSVYEVNNTKRILDNIQIQIKEKYGKLFTADDSVVIFEVSNSSVLKFGNAIHRDKDVFFF